jgi:hypothetical protein
MQEKRGSHNHVIWCSVAGIWCWHLLTQSRWSVYMNFVCTRFQLLEELPTSPNTTTRYVTRKYSIERTPILNFQDYIFTNRHRSYICYIPERKLNIHQADTG